MIRFYWKLTNYILNNQLYTIIRYNTRLKIINTLWKFIICAVLCCVYFNFFRILVAKTVAKLVHGSGGWVGGAEAIGPLRKCVQQTVHGCRCAPVFHAFYQAHAGGCLAFCAVHHSFRVRALTKLQLCACQTSYRLNQTSSLFIDHFDHDHCGNSFASECACLYNEWYFRLSYLPLNPRWSDCALHIDIESGTCVNACQTWSPPASSVGVVCQRLLGLALLLKLDGLIHRSDQGGTGQLSIESELRLHLVWRKALAQHCNSFTHAALLRCADLPAELHLQDPPPSRHIWCAAAMRGSSCWASLAGSLSMSPVCGCALNHKWFYDTKPNHV